MFKNTLVLAGFAMSVALSVPAHGETIDTFSFTDTGWSEYALGVGTLTPSPSTVLNGAFTGVVEPNGFIEQSDLTQFSVQFESPNFSPYSLLQQELTLFSYDTASGGGPSSLDFAGTPGGFTNVCIGAATSLDPNCAFFNQPYLPGTVGTVLLNLGDRDFVSSSAPQITLVSSTFTTPTPEPAPIFLGGIGLAVIAILARRRTPSRRCIRLRGTAGV
jgi:hypothetical protein